MAKQGSVQLCYKFMDITTWRSSVISIGSVYLFTAFWEIME